MEHLGEVAKEFVQQEEIAILAGDYNIIPQNDDVYDPKAWQGDALNDAAITPQLSDFTKSWFI